MKRIITLVSCGVLILILAACTPSDTQAPSVDASSKPNGELDFFSPVGLTHEELEEYSSGFDYTYSTEGYDFAFTETLIDIASFSMDSQNEPLVCDFIARDDKFVAIYSDGYIEIYDRELELLQTVYFDDKVSQQSLCAGCLDSKGQLYVLSGVGNLSQKADLYILNTEFKILEHIVIEVDTTGKAMLFDSIAVLDNGVVYFAAGGYIYCLGLDKSLTKNGCLSYGWLCASGEEAVFLNGGFGYTSTGEGRIGISSLYSLRELTPTRIERLPAFIDLPFTADEIVSLKSNDPEFDERENSTWREFVHQGYNGIVRSSDGYILLSRNLLLFFDENFSYQSTVRIPYSTYLGSRVASYTKWLSITPSGELCFFVTAVDFEEDGSSGARVESYIVTAVKSS